MSFPGKSGSAAPVPAASDTVAVIAGPPAGAEVVARVTETTGVPETSPVTETPDVPEQNIPVDSTNLATVGDILATVPDSLQRDSLPHPDSLALRPDSLAVVQADSLSADSVKQHKYGKPFLDEIISGKNADSLIYDVQSRQIHAYNQVEILYLDKKLQADYVLMGMDDKMVKAHGVPDSTGALTRSMFSDAGHEYDIVDSILYNLDTGKARIKGVWTTEGEGFLTGTLVKKMPDNSINIAYGTYTTCDAEHPHYYIRMTRAKTMPGKKTIFGYTYMVIEDVPIPFPGLPFGFFPMNSERSSGFIMPSVGEEYVKGFYLRDGGYYFAPNDYIDMSLIGGVYTKGSWEAKFNSRYRKRYRYNGGISLAYSNSKFGDQGSADWSDQKTYSVAWTHSQDPKFKPGQTFSANVNFSSSQHNKYAPGSINDYATNQTNSSVAFSRNWAGTPFSLTASMRHSQINKDTVVTLDFPNFTFSMSRVTPFKFKNRKAGPERWYEKIALSYNTTFTNGVSRVKEYDLFKKPMFDQMETSMTHSVPVSASFTMFGYINITPSLSYSENWNAKKTVQQWDAQSEKVVTEKVRGFHRVYNYSGSVSANTTLFGMYDAFGPFSKIQAVRHTINPSVSFSFRPDFGKEKYGFWYPYQTDASGTIGYYSPYVGAPGRGSAASINFTLKQTLEAKVRSDKDSTGVRKIKIIDDLTIGSISYNFIADSFKWSSSVPVTLRSTLIKGFNLNLSTSFGMYAYEDGKMVDKLLIAQGKFPRLERLGTSFNWSKQFGKGDANAMNTGSNITDPNAMYANPFDPTNPFADPVIEEMDEQDRQEQVNAYRHLLTSQYYDFSVPLNVNFSYSINYANTGVKKTITQTLSFGGSMNLTPKWGITFNSGYDFQAKKLISTTNFTLSRDLHCMQMHFTWSPIGYMRSWNFLISIKANILRDLKYEKSGSRYDSMY